MRLVVDANYVACAIHCDANIWSDDIDFEEQDVVKTHTTTDVIDSFDRR